MGDDLNTGNEWSELDIADLRASRDQGDSIEQTARFLCRSVDEIRAKAAELGLG